MKALPEPFAARLASLDERFRKLAPRERIAIGCLVVALVFFALDLLLIRPITRERETVALRIARTRDAIESIQRETALLARRSSGSREAAQDSEAMRLRRQIERIEERMQPQLEHLVPPRAVVAVLEELLAEESGLAVVKLESLPPVRLGAGDDGSREARSGDDTGLYRHGVRLRLEGTYAATLRFLRELEAAPWNLVFDRLAYRVEQHPEATVTLELHTLGEREEWIGV